MRKSIASATYMILTMSFVSPVWADSPPNITTPDSHSREVVGKITRYRVQVEGLEIGQNTDATDAEILVTLGTDTTKAYTVRLHSDSPPVNRIMADALREAFINNVKVRIYHQITPSQHLKINMIQLER